MVDIGLKVLLSAIPTPRPELEVKVTEFYIKKFYQGQSFCIKDYETLHYKDPLMDFIYIWDDDRYRSKVLLSAILTPGPDLEVSHRRRIFIYNSNFFNLIL